MGAPPSLITAGLPPVAGYWRANTLEGDFRDSLVGGLAQAGLTDDQSRCAIAELIDGGVDARDVFLAGVVEELQAGFGEQVQAAIAACS